MSTKVKKLRSLEEITQIAKDAHKSGKKIVSTNGCFDLLHVGHVRNLAAAKKLGDLLIVGINSDASVRQNKGHSRPIIPARERAEVVGSLESVDLVFIFSGKTPFSWIQKLRPHIHVKGADVKNDQNFKAQKEVIKKNGGVFALIPMSKGRSTTSIIEAAARSCSKK